MPVSNVMLPVVVAGAWMLDKVCTGTGRHEGTRVANFGRYSEYQAVNRGSESNRGCNRDCSSALSCHPSFHCSQPRCRTISLSFILGVANSLHSRPVNPRVVQVCIGFFQALKSIKARCIPQCSSKSFLFMRMMHSTVFSLAGFFHLAIFLSVVHVRIY